MSYNWKELGIELKTSKSAGQTVPVFVSEYTAPDDFECILEIEHRSTLSSTNNSKRVVEKLFWNGV